MKKCLLILLLFCFKNSFSQLAEGFDDGNFTNNPVWSGSNSGNDFIVTSNRLRSNSTTLNSNFYLSTAQTLATNCTWEFYCNLQFATSGSNYVDIYLTSDKADLQNSSINGYFVRIGNTDDEISLYKRSGSLISSVKIIDGINGSVSSTTNNSVKVRVSRTSANQFTLERDMTGTGSAYFNEGSVTDASFITSAYFGIYIQQSVLSFTQKHFFDDFLIQQLVVDNTPPKLLSATATDTLTVEVVFDEVLDSTIAKQTANYSIDNSIANPAKVSTTTDPLRYRLTLNKSLNTSSYIITATNITDKAGNIISSNNTASFNFFKPYIAKAGDIVINEIFADPTPQIDLPSVEFIELFNTTNNVIFLKNWSYGDITSAYRFTKDSIPANGYLLLCAKSDTSEFKKYGHVLGISPWPSLNNAGDDIWLKNDHNTTISQVTYSDSWYRTETKKQGGWTLERVDPKSACKGLFNWKASVDVSGGTPNKQNSTYISSYDLLPYKADSLKQLTDTTLIVYFNKHTDITSCNFSSFNLSPKTATVKSFVFDTDARQVIIRYDQKLNPSTTYSFSVSGATDCSGNLISNINQPLHFKSPALPLIPAVRADTSRLILTEIFADPSPEVGLPLVEFIEIYNPGKDTVDLEGWTLNDPTTKATFKKSNIASGEYVILCPVADTLQYKIFGKTIGLSPWPSLNNSSDQITLKSFKGRTVDSVAYSDSWYKNQVKKSGGWSLEKIDHNSKCDAFFNWTASIDPIGGTPGRQNSVYKSNYDQLPLTADSLKLISDTTLKIYFAKYPDASTVTTNAFKITPTTVTKRIITDVENKLITLTFGSKLTPNTAFELTINGLKDCSGNTITSLNQPFHFKSPALPPVPPVRADTSRLILTEIFADPSPEVGLPLVEFIEIYNPGKDTVDLEGWTLSDPTTKATIRTSSILPEQYIIFCPLADTLQYRPFGKTVGINPWPSLNNSSDQIILKSFKGRLVDSVAYVDTWYKNQVKKSGGWSLEKIDHNSKCDAFFNWTASFDPTGGTPGRQNSVYKSNYDQLLLTADSLKLISDTTLKIYFAKYPDASTVTTNAFKITPATITKRIVTDVENKLITLTFGSKLTPNTDFELTINGLKDCSGNTISLLNQPLHFKSPALPPSPPVRADTSRLILTEIFADPSPEVGLPLVEFIEIYNPGKDMVDLEGWTLSDPTTKATFKKSNIASGEYVILCTAADTLQYKSFGKTIGLSPWPSLNNSSDQVVLKSFKGRLVDSVAYYDTWYKDAVKKQGGWSLEKINLTKNSCNGFYAWSASKDKTGGTPGKPNSLSSIYDILKIDSVIALSDSSIRLYLNSTPDTGSIKTAIFSLDNGIGNAKSLAILSSDFQKINLQFNVKFQEGQSYKLKVEELVNCSGTLFQSPNDISFDIPLIPENDYPIVINEIFADPSPVIGLPEIEFIELLNPTNKPVSLKGLSYGDQTIRHFFSSGEINANGYLILCAAKDTINYKSYGRVVGLPNWPSLNNDKDILILRNNKGREIHRVMYDNTWYKDAVKKQGGYSLELIDPFAVCTGIQNWNASKDASGGTPGKQNSVYKTNTSTETLGLASAKLVDSVTISITFNRFADSLSAANPRNYSVNNGIGNPASAKAVYPLFEQVLLKFSQPFVRGNTFNLTLSGITDCAGGLISASANKFEFFYPKKIAKGDILINEVLFNPRLNGVDFVEIYNNSSSPLDLKDLYIANLAKDTVANQKSVSLTSLLIQPKQYYVLTTDPDNIKKEYRSENPNGFIKLASMPSFNDDAGNVILISDKTKIDHFAYTEKMHFPLIKNSEGISLERSSFSKPTNEVGNFRSAASIVGYATPAYKNSQTVEEILSEDELFLTSKTFSPDNDGFEDILQINYHFNKPGLVLNAHIYNDKGILIKRIAKNLTLNSKGSIIWDGINEFNERCQMGIYLVYADVFDADGTIKKYRRTFALAAKF